MNRIVTARTTAAAILVLVVVAAIITALDNSLHNAASTSGQAASGGTVSYRDGTSNAPAAMRSFFQYTFNEYTLRFGVAPSSFSDVQAKGVAFVPLVNALTHEPLKNSCDKPSPGHYCFDPEGKQYFFWDATGSVDVNTPKREAWAGRFESWRKNAAKAAAGAGLYNRARKAGYSEADLDWLMAGWILSYRLPSRICQDNASDGEALRKAVWVFPYDQMSVRGEPFEKHFTLSKEAGKVTYEVKVADKSLLRVVYEKTTGPDGDVSCPGTIESPPG